MTILCALLVLIVTMLITTITSLYDLTIYVVVHLLHIVTTDQHYMQCYKSAHSGLEYDHQSKL